MTQSRSGKNLKNTFGYEAVDAAERGRRIRRLFDSISYRYDLMNDAMSFGIHRLWKRKLAHRVQRRPGQVIVDLAGGTGDIAKQLRGPGVQTIIADASRAMMLAGRTGDALDIHYVSNAGECLALRSGCADVVTVSFGMRNMTQMETALREIVRILKPEGRFYCLEFSKPHSLIRPFYDLYSFFVIPRLGAWVARQPQAYTYLVESIRRFPDQDEMKTLMESAGLADVTYRNLSFGIACIHEGVKH